ncbi:MAG: hypothetical protein ACK5WZ_11700 [Pseudobdellovibrionaceae bacterium]
MSAVPVIQNSGRNDARIVVDFKDLGTPDTLRYRILNDVLNERYDHAIQELRTYIDQGSDYPNFKDKVQRYVNHSIDLTYAIKTKKNFPGINSLTRAKQQELHEKFKEHFRELQMMLKKIEQINQDLRIQDVRSTIYVVKALWMSSTAILVLAFVLDVFNGMAKTFVLVFEDYTNQFVGWLFSMMGM